jgi:CRISPR-associated protein Csh1
LIEGIKDLGELVESSGRGFADLLVREPKINLKDGKTAYVIGVNFDVSGKQVTFIERVYSPGKSPKEFLFVGNPSANNPKDKATVSGDQVKYFFTSTLPIIKNKINDEEISSKIDRVLSEFFIENDGAFRVDVKKMNLCDDIPDNLYDTKEKEFSKTIAECVFKKIEKEKGIKKKEIALFTLMINGDYIAKTPAYRSYIANNAFKDSFKDAKNGTCYVCGKKNVPVSSDTTKFDLKYYITQKINFASGFKKANFVKNFAVCEDCYRKILEGEAFLQNNLQSKLFGLTMYIIPKFVFKTTISYRNLDEWADIIKYFVTSPNAIENYNAFKEEVSNNIAFDDEKNNYMFDIVLALKSNSAVKINELIKDVPPSRIDELVEEQETLEKWANDNISSSKSMWRLTFNSIYYLFPVRKRTTDKFLVNLYARMMRGEKVSYEMLIKKFIEVARVNAYELKGQYNIDGDIKKNLHRTILKQDLFLQYLKELNLLKGGEAMNFDELNVKDDLKEFLRKMGYDEQKTAMFLLGYLVGEIGAAQYSDGMQKKPILKKITYQGMGIKRIVPFVNEIFEKLTQYDKLQYNEPIFSAAKALLDKNIDNWALSDQENVFYILSGYAFETQKIMTSSQNSSSDETSNK